MSDIIVPGFKSSELIAELAKVFDQMSDDERAKLMKQVNIIFYEQFFLIHRLFLSFFDYNLFPHKHVC